MGTPRGPCRLSPSCPLLCLGRLEQLGFNALLQLMIGVPLEMVHGILRISFLYLAGVLAGACSPGKGEGLSPSPPISPCHQHREVHPESDGDAGLCWLPPHSASSTWLGGNAARN